MQLPVTSTLYKKKVDFLLQGTGIYSVTDFRTHTHTHTKYSNKCDHLVQTPCSAAARPPATPAPVGGSHLLSEVMFHWSTGAQPLMGIFPVGLFRREQLREGGGKSQPRRGSLPAPVPCPSPAEREGCWSRGSLPAPSQPARM